MRGEELVGIITESHLFSVLMELFGARRPGVRIMAEVSLEKGGLAKLSTAVASAGGQFVAFGIHTDHEAVTFKVQGVGQDKLVEAVKPAVKQLLDVREV
jgi:acetoin utilization protein AcuB